MEPVEGRIRYNRCWEQIEGDPLGFRHLCWTSPWVKEYRDAGLRGRYEKPWHLRSIRPLLFTCKLVYAQIRPPARQAFDNVQIQRGRKHTIRAEHPRLPPLRGCVQIATGHAPPSIPTAATPALQHSFRVHASQPPAKFSEPACNALDAARQTRAVAFCMRDLRVSSPPATCEDCHCIGLSARYS